jgi:hypothetical protein
VTGPAKEAIAKCGDGVRAYGEVRKIAERYREKRKETPGEDTHNFGKTKAKRRKGTVELLGTES